MCSVFQILFLQKNSIILYPRIVWSELLYPKLSSQIMLRGYFFLEDGELWAWQGSSPGCQDMAQMIFGNSFCFFNPGCILYKYYMQSFRSRREQIERDGAHPFSLISNRLNRLCAILFYQWYEGRDLWFLIISMWYSAGTGSDILSSLSFVSRFECINSYADHSVAEFTVTLMLEKETSIY